MVHSLASSIQGSGSARRGETVGPREGGAAAADGCQRRERSAGETNSGTLVQVLIVEIAACMG